jgi:hypothetical protein
MFVSLGLWNANGLQRTAIDDVLQHCTNVHILFITETWLLPPSRLPTEWQQHHNYALPVIDPRDPRRRNRGQYGITTLISPTCPFPVLPLPSSSPYISSFRIGTTHIVCCYIPPDLPGPDDSVAYNDILNAIPLLPDTILCGDFNARLGPITGDTATNTRGRLLTAWMEDRQLLLWQTPAIFGVPTFCTFRGADVHQSVIDLFLSNFPADIIEMSVRTDLSLSSDHRLVLASLDLPDMAEDTSRPPGRRMWNLSRLQEEEVCDLYVRAFSSASHALRARLLVHLEQPHLGRPNIDQLTDELNELIYFTLSQSVGDKKPRPKYWKWFWTPALIDAAAARDYCYRRWNRAVGLEKVPWWERYLATLHAFRRGVKRARRQAYRAFCDALERNFAAATSKIKAIRRRRQVQPTYCHPDGPVAAVETMSQQLASVSDGRFLPHSRLPAPELPPGPHSLDDCPFTLNSVDAAIRRLPNRKAPGADHLRAEMLKPIRVPLSRILLLLFQLCWTWSYTPPGWRHAQVCPIYKKGDPTLASNYRPISLTSILRKAMEYCIAPALTAESPELDLAQGGFRPQRSAMDQALCLHELMHMQRQRQHRPTVVAFLDIKSAYDTVDRNIIWQALAVHGTNKGLLSLLQNLFDEVTTSVLLSNQTSSPSSPATGVLQGSVLSPHLYSIYINTLPEALRAAASPNTIRVADPPTAINSLLFADDVAILGSIAEVQRMLDIAADHSHQLGYRWSPTKCAVLNAPRPLTLYGEELQSVEEFVYLGLPFRKNGLSASSLIKHRTQGTRLAMASLQAIGARPSGFHPLLSARLYRQFIRPKFEYGLAISRLLKVDIQALNRLQDRCLRMITGGHATSTIHPFRHMSDLPTMGTRALTLTFKFCVRLTYLPDDCLISLLSPILPPKCRLPLLLLNPLYTALPNPPPRDLKPLILEHRQRELEFLRQSLILVRGCRPTLGIDPILLVPATRRERSRLLRWRLGWLPGKPRDCRCGTDHTSRRHLMECPLLPQHLWQQLPYPSDGSNHLDYAISQIPASIHTPPAYWPALLTILHLIDQMCLQEGTLPAEPNPGSSWMTPRPVSERDPSPLL